MSEIKTYRIYTANDEDGKEFQTKLANWEAKHPGMKIIGTESKPYRTGSILLEHVIYYR